MKLQASKYKGNGCKTKLFTVDAATPVEIIENHADDSLCEKITIIFSSNGENYISEEFRPSEISTSGHKAADILALVLNEKANAYIYDIKRKFENDDEILHFIEQVNSTYCDAQGLLYMAHYPMNNRFFVIGVITTLYNGDLIRKQLDYHKKQLLILEENLSGNNLALKMNARKSYNREQQYVNCLDSVLRNTVIMEDGKEYMLDVKIMNETKSGYEYELVI